MPVILALDGSGDAFSAAVNAGGAVHCAARADVPQAECALPLVQELLGAHSLTLAACDAFAFAAGPGKFSALRLVCALARSFAYAQKKALLAVPGFAALAQANYGEAECTVKCALPAHQEHIYYATCARTQGDIWRVQRAAVRRCAGKAPGGKIRLACGEGYRHHPHLLGGAEFCDNALHSHAAAVWQVAEGMLARNEVSDPLHCEPIYLRRQVAQTTHQRQCNRKR